MLFYLIGVTILVVKQMKKVWATTSMDILEEKEKSEDNDEVKMKAVILVAEGDNEVHATIEQMNTNNISIV